MPRLNSGLEVLERLTSMRKFYLPDPVVKTTSTGAIAKAASALTLASAVGFADEDDILVASEAGAELLHVSALAGAAVTSATPAAIAHPSTSPIQIYKALSADLGHLDENGVQMTGAMQLQPVNASTSKVAIAYIAQAGTLGGNFSLRGYNNPNLATVFGMPEPSEAGQTGTEANPYALAITERGIGTASLLCFRGRGVLIDGSIVEVDFVNCRPSVNANVQLGGNNPATLGVAFNCTAIVSKIWQ